MSSRGLQGRLPLVPIAKVGRHIVVLQRRLCMCWLTERHTQTAYCLLTSTRLATLLLQITYSATARHQIVRLMYSLAQVLPHTYTYAHTHTHTRTHAHTHTHAHTQIQTHTRPHMHIAGWAGAGADAGEIGEGAQELLRSNMRRLRLEIACKWA